MKKHKWTLVIINLIIVLIFFNASLIKKEKTLADGTLVLLELTPVDPRSLMQGDYMDLNYRSLSRIDYDQPTEFGYCILSVDPSGVARMKRLQPELEPCAADELVVKYHASYSNIYLGAESYFFQEGTGKKYEDAQYGGLRIDDQGNSILVGLYDKNGVYIGLAEKR